MERFLFNETTESFLKVVYNHLLEITRNETDLVVTRRRVQIGTIKVPFQLVVFEGSKLGYFCRTTSRIAINKRLMYQTTTHTLKNIIRHELAHLVAYYKFHERTHHGDYFKAICSQYGWDKEVSPATVDLNESNESATGDLRSERLINKISKLLSLATSENKHEAEMAIAKANALMLSHNLTHLRESTNHELEDSYIVQLHEGAKVTEKMRAISQVLANYMVYPVFNHGKGSFILEITGTKENCELGEYLFHFLDRQFERLWEDARINESLKGMREKNSFMRALSQSIIKKLNSEKSELSHTVAAKKNELAHLNNQLMLHVERGYTNLTTSSSQSKIDQNAYDAGRRAGRDFSINLPLSYKKEERRLLR